jgi:NAD(P)-dependent dehydrogenase (short-subunit alcohol dehydrogenase family)
MLNQHHRCFVVNGDDNAFNTKKEAVMDSIKGKGVLITGASRGLGAELVRELAEGGAKVVGVARGATDLRHYFEKLRLEGLDVHPVAGDVGQVDQARAIAAQAVSILGRVDLLIHNASSLGPTPLPHLLDLDLGEAQRVLDVNVLGPLALPQAVVGTMAARGRGMLVLISSDAAVEAYEGWGIYGASKAAQDHLGKTLAAELSGTQIRVMAVDPGEMNTAMHAAALPDADPHPLQSPAHAARRLVGEILKEAGPGFRRVAS